MPQSPSIGKFKRATAKRLRQNSTPAEERLWRRLKHLDMNGSHFRRQMPIGNFIVDFACPAARLVIEVDGSQHGKENTVFRDERRTEWLKSEGYRVLRFWNSDVVQNIDAVMESIYAELFGSSAAAPRILKHQRRRTLARPVTPPRPPSR